MARRRRSVVRRRCVLRMIGRIGGVGCMLRRRMMIGRVGRVVPWRRRVVWRWIPSASTPRWRSVAVRSGVVVCRGWIPLCRGWIPLCRGVIHWVRFRRLRVRARGGWRCDRGGGIGVAVGV